MGNIFESETVDVEVVTESEAVEVEVVAAESAGLPADVQRFPNGWALVTFGAWQVSISEDGLIRLPHSVMPETVPDLVGALEAAAVVSAEIRAANKAKAASALPGIQSRGGLVVQAGPPPAGAVRLPVAPRL